MGDEQKLSADEQIDLAREQFEEGTDFTLAVEEEFAVLDPATLSLVNRFEDIQAAAEGSELRTHLAGELIASEVEVKTGRCESFDEAARKLAERRSQVLALCDSLGIALGATGTHPWSPWQEQRIIDTPHYRRNDEILRYVVWRNNTFGLHVHVGIRGADRAVAVHNALRSYLPDLLALSASSPFVEDCFTHLHSARSQIFTKMFPRCGVPDAYRGLGRLRDVPALPLRDRIGDGAHAALVERSPSSRLSDRRDPHLRRAAGARRGRLPFRAHLRAHGPYRARRRRG